MYDVRGIQDYIFRTSKLKDAIGASSIVENIIEDALRSAVDDVKENMSLIASLEWYDDKGPFEYDDHQINDIQVLYIGGGNAYIRFRDRELAVEVSKRMSRYTLNNTYSLQLATAIISKTNNYYTDYKNLRDEMTKVKDGMKVSKPLDALPIVDVEAKTGFPITLSGISKESQLKKDAADKVRKNLNLSKKMFDSYVEQKGESSMLAVVHIDGNNMAQRIKELIEGIDNYTAAINTIRKISFSINNSYKKVFEEMHMLFNTNREKDKWWLMKVIVAGDDITYVCNAKIALATVEYFCKRISQYGMLESEGNKYKFTACAGVSFYNSHFPFNIAYGVAEACCDSAKDRAKEEKYKDNELVGNWMDFQFCRSVQALNLNKLRNEEYITSRGEKLLKRPYYIPSEELQKESTRFKELEHKTISFEELKNEIKYFLDENNIPRSFTKDLRNTYPLGEEQVEILKAFLLSRAKNDKNKAYLNKMYVGDDEQKGTKIATFYDALEVLDYYQDLEEILKEVQA